jgi:uncharacterized protein (DUF169 family)
MKMTAIKKFEHLIGGRWTGVIFHHRNDAKDNLAKNPMRFCEAVKQSSTRPVTLTKDLVACPGAYLSGKVCLSFGCPESCKYGAISSDRLIIGFPTPVDKRFF